MNNLYSAEKSNIQGLQQAQNQVQNARYRGSQKDGSIQPLFFGCCDTS